jgi:hypothetical protein
MACEEMQLFYAYLDEIEEQKRKAQPWLCEVTVLPLDDDGGATAAKPVVQAAPVTSPRVAGAKSGFVCDDPE